MCPEDIPRRRYLKSWYTADTQRNLWGDEKSWRQGGFGALLIFLESGFWVKKNDGAVIILTMVFDNMRKVKYMVMHFFFGQANRQIMWGILEPLGHTNYGRDFFSYRKRLPRSGLFQFQRSFERKMMVQWVLWKSYPKLWRIFSYVPYLFILEWKRGEGNRPWGYEAMTCKTLDHMDLSQTWKPLRRWWR